MHHTAMPNVIYYTVSVLSFYEACGWTVRLQVSLKLK